MSTKYSWPLVQKRTAPLPWRVDFLQIMSGCVHRTKTISLALKAEGDFELQLWILLSGLKHTPSPPNSEATREMEAQENCTDSVARDLSKTYPDDHDTFS